MIYNFSYRLYHDTYLQHVVSYIDQIKNQTIQKIIQIATRFFHLFFPFLIHKEQQIPSTNIPVEPVLLPLPTHNALPLPSPSEEQQISSTNNSPTQLQIQKVLPPEKSFCLLTPFQQRDHTADLKWDHEHQCILIENIQLSAVSSFQDRVEFAISLIIEAGRQSLPHAYKVLVGVPSMELDILFGCLELLEIDQNYTITKVLTACAPDKKRCLVQNSDLEKLAKLRAEYNTRLETLKNNNNLNQQSLGSLKSTYLDPISEVRTSLTHRACIARCDLHFNLYNFKKITNDSTLSMDINNVGKVLSKIAEQEFPYSLALSFVDGSYYYFGVHRNIQQETVSITKVEIENFPDIHKLPLKPLVCCYGYSINTIFLCPKAAQSKKMTIKAHTLKEAEVLLVLGFLPETYFKVLHPLYEKYVEFIETCLSMIYRNAKDQLKTKKQCLEYFKNLDPVQIRTKYLQLQTLITSETTAAYQKNNEIQKSLSDIHQRLSSLDYKKSPCFVPASDGNKKVWKDVLSGLPIELHFKLDCAMALQTAYATN